MTGHFVFVGDGTQGRSVAISRADAPLADPNEPLRVTLRADDLEATAEAEFLGRDSGRSTTAPFVELSQFLVDLGQGPLWDGSRSWQSLDGGLEIGLTVDRAGHVEATFLIDPTRLETTWSARSTISYNLGDLTDVGRRLAAWFVERTT